MHMTTMLDTAFICEACRIVMIFESDRDEHKRITGHSKFITHDLAVGRDATEYGDK